MGTIIITLFKLTYFLRAMKSEEIGGRQIFLKMNIIRRCT